MQEADFSYADDLSLLKEAALAAGEIAMSYFSGDLKVAIREKAPGDPVTNADIAVNEKLEEILRPLRPGYGWLSEETADDETRLGARRSFIVDPIDGTAGFIKRRPHFSIVLCVMEDNAPVVSVIYNPARKELYTCIKGEGAYCNDEALQVSDEETLQGCTIMADPNMLAHPDWPRPWPDMNRISPTPNSIAYRICLVAAGKADGAFTLSAKWDWDVAAATLVLEEAGGRITTHVNEPYEFNRPIPKQRNMIAGNPVIHKAIIDRVSFLKLPSS